MSVFAPQKPSEGWKRRWPEEAANLMRGTAYLLVIFVSVCMVGGFISAIAQEGPLKIFTESLLCVFVFCPLISWLFHALGKHEAYVSGRFTGYQECIKLTLFLAIFVAVFLSLLWIGAVSGQVPEDKPVLTLSRVIAEASDGLTMAFIFSYTGMFRLLTVPMVNSGHIHNEIIARRSHDKLKEVFPRVTITTFLVSMWSEIILPPAVHFVLQVFLLYVIYVAGREIIGGITGNKDVARETHFEALPA